MTVFTASPSPPPATVGGGDDDGPAVEAIRALAWASSVLERVSGDVLAHGGVAEIGTHDELLSRRGRYASMWEAFDLVGGGAP